MTNRKLGLSLPPSRTFLGFFSFSNTQPSVPASASPSVLLHILTSVNPSLYLFFHSFIQQILIEYFIVTSSRHHGFIRKQETKTPSFIVSANVTSSEAQFLLVYHIGLFCCFIASFTLRGCPIYLLHVCCIFSPRIQAPRGQGQCPSCSSLHHQDLGQGLVHSRHCKY